MSYQAVPVLDTGLLEEQTYQQAQLVVRKAWFEEDRLTTLLYFILLVPLFGVFWWQFKLQPPLAWSIVGLMSYTVGFVADSYTTWRCLRLAPEFERRGVDFPLREQNPFMKDKPNLIEQWVNVSTLYSLGVGVAAWLVPGSGIAAGLAHGAAARNNEFKWRRLRVQLRLIDLKREESDMGKGQKHTESQE